MYSLLQCRYSCYQALHLLIQGAGSLNLDVGETLSSVPIHLANWFRRVKNDVPKTFGRWASKWHPLFTTVHTPLCKTVRRLGNAVQSCAREYKENTHTSVLLGLVERWGTMGEPGQQHRCDHKSLTIVGHFDKVGVREKAEV